MLHIKDNVSEEKLRKINEALVKFDDFIQSETKVPTDKNINI